MSGLSAVTFAVLGIGVGSVFFPLLYWNARLYAYGSSPLLAVLFQLARLTALGSALAITAGYGASPLLLATSGFLVTRPVALRLLAGGAQ